MTSESTGKTGLFVSQAILGSPFDRSRNEGPGDRNSIYKWTSPVLGISVDPLHWDFSIKWTHRTHQSEWIHHLYRAVWSTWSNCTVLPAAQYPLRSNGFATGWPPLSAALFLCGPRLAIILRSAGIYQAGRVKRPFYLTIGIQVPSQKVLGPSKPT